VAHPLRICFLQRRVAYPLRFCLFAKGGGGPLASAGGCTILVRTFPSSSIASLRPRTADPSSSQARSAAVVRTNLGAASFGFKGAGVDCLCFRRWRLAPSLVRPSSSIESLRPRKGRGMGGGPSFAYLLFAKGGSFFLFVVLFNPLDRFSIFPFAPWHKTKSCSTANPADVRQVRSSRDSCAYNRVFLFSSYGSIH
jgi:hypothetical protein